MASVHTVSFEYSDDDRNPTTFVIGVYGNPYQDSQPYPTSYDIVGMQTISLFLSNCFSCLSINTHTLFDAVHYSLGNAILNYLSETIILDM
jgi:hypothetical protein